MVLIPNGTYSPLFKAEDGVKNIPVNAFYLDSYLVSNNEFNKFINSHPKWQKKTSKSIFNDVNYLKHLEVGGISIKAEQPVINVSWFAARAYCKSLNKRLPTTAEWEYVAAASETQANGKDEPGYKQKILDWYAKPASAELPNIQQTPVNYWGIHGMHGVVWELVNDFNTSLVTGESRGDSQLEKALFCGAGAASSVDPGDYAAFMRYALRSSYEANYTMESLGFRCAKDLSLEEKKRK
ncbi:MAG: formylglycine-generating enzyme family protein [Alcanivoracaceae bacterium]|nr:formylglycine-generating enzyme family protein [Alcanivoracaceae bacterium]